MLPPIALLRYRPLLPGACRDAGMAARERPASSSAAAAAGARAATAGPEGRTVGRRGATCHGRGAAAAAVRGVPFAAAAAALGTGPAQGTGSPGVVVAVAVAAAAAAARFCLDPLPKRPDRKPPPPDDFFPGLSSSYIDGCLWGCICGRCCCGWEMSETEMGRELAVSLRSRPASAPAGTASCWVVGASEGGP